jgi:hypothetical protein
MRRIGIDQALAEIYESAGNYWRICLPAPIVTGAILDPVFPLTPNGITQMPYVFREDYFDPTARIRRGRFYVPSPGQRPAPQQVLPRHASDAVEGLFEKLLFVYDDYFLSRSATSPKLVVLGTPGFLSFWQVVSPPEPISSGEFLFVLKARGSFGVLPETEPTAIPEHGRAKVIETLGQLADAAHRESPGSIIDRARDAAQWCLATWAASEFGDVRLQQEDLGHLIQTINGKRQMVALRAAEIVQRLHSRVKPNEQERYGFRPPMEADAELALNSVSFLIRELGWARD